MGLAHFLDFRELAEDEEDASDFELEENSGEEEEIDEEDED